TKNCKPLRPNSGSFSNNHRTRGTLIGYEWTRSYKPRGSPDRTQPRAGSNGRGNRFLVSTPDQRARRRGFDRYRIHIGRRPYSRKHAHASNDEVSARGAAALDSDFRL